MIELEKATNGCEDCYFDIETKEFNGCGTSSILREESSCNILYLSEQEHIWRKISD